MNGRKRLVMGGRRQRPVRGSFKLGVLLFSGMVILCIIGSVMRPLQPYVSHGDLKNLAPNTSYLHGANTMKGTEIVDIQSGRDFTFALTSDYQLHSWGNSKLKDLAINKNITKIAAGDTHFLVLDDENTVFSYGSNTFGETSIPAEIAKLSIENIYAGEGVSAVLTNDHRLFTWGNLHPKISIPEAFQTHIVAVDFSSTHMALLLEDGTVHVLGNSGSEIMDVPEELIGKHIVDVRLSKQEAIALDETGRIYVWGERFSISDFEQKDMYTQIAASKDAVFALDKEHKVVSVGNGSFDETKDINEAYDAIYADQYQIYGIRGGRVDAWGNAGFPLGSDAYGRDILTRLCHGGLITMGIGIIACFIEAILGVFFGMWAGYKGGWIDNIIMRIAEVLASLPFLPLMITLSAFLKDSLDTTSRIVLIMLLLGILNAPNLARIIRSEILIVKTKSYVEASKMFGANTFWILRKSLFPQITHLLLVNITLSYADNMVIESALSFLGFGVQAPYPTWGNMLDGAQSTFVLKNCWWQWLLPAGCIFLCVFAVNLMGEGLRKKLSKKSGGGWL